MQLITIDDNSQTTQWYLTGDMCFIDENNQINFVTRFDAKEKSNGKRFNLVRINEALELHHAVAKAATFFDGVKIILYAFIQ